MKDVFKILIFCAALGAGVFALLVAQLTTVSDVPPDSVNLRFRGVVRNFDDPTPMRALDGSGRVLHLRQRDQRIVPAAPSDVVILAWRGPEEGLVESRIPIWLLGLSEPLRDWMLRDSQFDPGDWGLTVNDIQSAGLGVVVDHVDRDGTRTLVWAE
jgi:hypothetical protein